MAASLQKKDILPSLKKIPVEKTTENQKYQYFVSLQVLQKNKIIYPVSKITSSLQKAELEFVTPVTPGGSVKILPAVKISPETT